jgi:hypothetical protein
MRTRMSHADYHIWNIADTVIKEKPLRCETVGAADSLLSLVVATFGRLVRNLFPIFVIPVRAKDVSYTPVDYSSMPIFA